MPPISHEVLYVVSGLMIVIGFVGTALPALPGIPLIFGGMLLAAWTGDFQAISGWTVAILGVLGLIALAVDFIASMLGTKLAGASRWAFIGAGIGTLVGLFFGLLGLLVGPFIGAIAGEAIATQNLRRATSAGIGATLGLLFGAVLKIAIAFTMFGVFALAMLIG